MARIDIRSSVSNVGRASAVTFPSFCRPCSSRYSFRNDDDDGPLLINVIFFVRGGPRPARATDGRRHSAVQHQVDESFAGEMTLSSSSSSVADESTAMSVCLTSFHSPKRWMGPLSLSLSESFITNLEKTKSICCWTRRGGQAECTSDRHRNDD